MLVVNQTDDTLQNCTLELFVWGRKNEGVIEKPAPVILAPKDFTALRASIEVSGTESGLIFGTIVYDIKVSRLHLETVNRVSIRFRTIFGYTRASLRRQICCFVRLRASYSGRLSKFRQGSTADRHIVVLNDIRVNIVDFLLPKKCSDAQFRRFWAILEWENTVRTFSFFLSFLLLLQTREFVLK